MQRTARNVQRFMVVPICQWMRSFVASLVIPHNSHMQIQGSPATRANPSLCDAAALRLESCRQTMGRVRSPREQTVRLRGGNDLGHPNRNAVPSHSEGLVAAGGQPWKDPGDRISTPKGLRREHLGGTVDGTPLGFAMRTTLQIQGRPAARANPSLCDATALRLESCEPTMERVRQRRRPASYPRSRRTPMSVHPVVLRLPHPGTHVIR